MASALSVRLGRASGPVIVVQEKAMALRRSRSPDRTLSVHKKRKTVAAAVGEAQPLDVGACERAALPQRITALLTEYRKRRQQGDTLCFRVLPKLRSSVLKLLRQSDVEFQVVDNIVYLEAPQSGLKGMVAPDVNQSLGGTPHASLDCLVRPDGKTELAPDVAWWTIAPTLQQRAKPSLLPLPDLWIEIVSMSTSGDYRSAVAKLPAVRRGKPACHFVILVLPCDVTKVRRQPALPAVVLDYNTNMLTHRPHGSLYVGYVPPSAHAVEASLRFHTIRSNMTLRLTGLPLNLNVSVVINAFV